VTGLLEHLDRQVRSSQRLLQLVLTQSEAIKRQDSEGVLATLGDLQVEMGQRQRLEVERDEILRRAGTELGLHANEVTLERILLLVPADEGAKARAASAELKGLLNEVERIHSQNTVLIRQELTFLDHLMRVLSGTPQGGYSPVGMTMAQPIANSVDARV
jgi:hypothetical protein